MKLPFIQESKWPISREDEERVANPSYDKQIQNHLVEELLQAIEKKDYSRLREALVALVLAIRDEETE